MIYMQNQHLQKQIAMDEPAQDRPARAATWMRRLRMRHLEVLLAISRHGSLTATADALNVSQPAVSQWLADIESAVGVALFVRGRRLQPTAYLDAVLRHAQRLVADSWRLEREIGAIGAGRSGTVRIGAMPVAGPALLPRALLQLRREGLDLRIEVVEDIADGLWPRLERNELDLIVGRLDIRAFAPDVFSEALYDDPHCVVAGRRHPLLGRSRTGWQDAARYPWVLPPAGTPLRRVIDATFVGRGLPPPQAWVESASLTTNQVILRDTECLGVLSGTAARHFVMMKALAIVPLRLSSEIGPVGMAWIDPEPGAPLRRAIGALRETGREMVHARARSQ